ncbi:MAG: hypothetical protein PWR19_2159 [Carnobacterium sp.]|uniref:hypothetical protein n=1 Tax=Carnobacterium sp. TaxID=48221 RepID=UPI0026479173|nr:hypothetical protein [Carnobacterium sp.]MDN5373113.1 hypothetical protein [Carnobacterium sp.]
MAKIDNEDLVSTYFYIQQRIDRAKGRIEEYEQDFNNKNFYTCIKERYEEMTTVAFRLEKEVTDHVAAIEMAEQHIKTLRFKLKHFDRFWSEVSSSDKEYYLDRYKRHREISNDKLDNLIVDEIREIEEAVNHYFKLEKARFYIKVSKHEVDPSKTDEEKFADFSNMLDILGV